MNSKNRFILNNLLASEFFLLNVVLLLFIYFTHGPEAFGSYDFVLNTLILVFIHNLSWLFIILFIRENQFYFDKKHNYSKSLLISAFCFIGIIISLTLLLKIKVFHQSVYIYPIVIFSYINFLIHRYILEYIKNNESRFRSNTLLIGSGYEKIKLKRFIKTITQHGYNVVGYLDEKNAAAEADLNVFGSIGKLNEVLSNNNIDIIFIDLSAFDKRQTIKMIEVADSFGVRVRLIPQYPLNLANNFKADALGTLAIFKLRQSPLDSFNNSLIKQLFDLSFAFLAILLLTPIYIIVAVCILINSKGPILYSPYRKGEAGKTFKCYKFRTMSVCDNPVSGTKSTVANDPRITRVGKILRKFDLDELPQFFNVLRGEMSIIGPRPHRINLQNDFRKSVNEYMVRSYIKPGITGWAQVNGWRGPTDTEEQKSERVKHDIWYIENWSFWLDTKILILTIFGRKKVTKALKLIRATGII